MNNTGPGTYAKKSLSSVATSQCLVYTQAILCIIVNYNNPSLVQKTFLALVCFITFILKRHTHTYI